MRIDLYERPLAEKEGKDLSDFHKANLRKLADYLKTLPVDYTDFDMVAFFRWKDYLKPECGSVACALGHAPHAGIGRMPLNKGFDWGLYCHRYFGFDNGLAWIWFFSARWAFVDNTPHGAAARIEWFLKFGGIPADAMEQQYSVCSLSYEVIQD